MSESTIAPQQAAAERPQPGDLNDQLIGQRLLDRADARRRGDPDHRRPVRHRRRRHRLVRDRRLPAHLRGPDRRHPRPDPAEAPVGELRVPDDGLADPPRRAAALATPPRRRTTSGASRATPSARACTATSSRCGTCWSSRSARTTTRRRRARPSSRWRRRCTASGYQEMVVHGQVRMVRRRVGGGYFTILTPPEGAAATRRIAYRSQCVHIAIGYPGLKFLPDLQKYRTEHQRLQQRRQRLRAARAHLRAAASCAPASC